MMQETILATCGDAHMKEKRVIYIHGNPVTQIVVNGMAVLDVERLKMNARKSTAAGRLARRKLEILERDFFKCVRCGNTEYLTIDHVSYDRRFYNTHHRAEDYPPDRCQTLCVWCHKEKNRKSGLIKVNCETCNRVVERRPRDVPPSGMVICPRCRD